MAKDFPGKTPAVAPVVAVVVVAVTAAAAEVGPTDCVPIPSMLRVSGGAIVVAGEVGPVEQPSPVGRPSPVRFRDNSEGRGAKTALLPPPTALNVGATGTSIELRLESKFGGAT